MIHAETKGEANLSTQGHARSRSLSFRASTRPGYLGHRETQPALSQEALNRYHTESVKLSLVLFDEIEKASDALWNLLLGILDKATLTLGDNRRVDFSQAMIFMTSNLGAAEMNAMLPAASRSVWQARLVLPRPFSEAQFRCPIYLPGINSEGLWISQDRRNWRSSRRVRYCTVIVPTLPPVGACTEMLPE